MKKAKNKETMKVRVHDFPISKVNKINDIASNFPRIKLRWKISGTMGIKENITKPKRENSNIFLGTYIVGLYLTGTRNIMYEPNSKP